MGGHRGYNRKDTETPAPLTILRDLINFFNDLNSIISKFNLVLTQN